MKDVLMITHFSQTPDETGNGRFVYLANLLRQNGCQVEMVTTAFSHKTKQPRVITQKHRLELPYTLTLLHEPAYRKNVSPRRLISHWVFGRCVKRYLRQRKSPDVVYCSVPSLDAAFQAVRYAEKKRVKLILDVQDLWPEAFKMVFAIPVVSDVLFSGMMRKADRIYRAADAIIAVSNTYAQRALRVNAKCKAAESVFLGTDLAEFNRLKAENRQEKPAGEFWIGYVGTLGHSYDLFSVIDAIAIVQESGCRHIRFVIMGDGPLRKRFEEYSARKGIRAEFTGRLEYGKMCGRLCACDVAVNPIAAGAAQSIINKVGDYAAAGLPVINTQECKEYRTLVDAWRIGINCENGDAVGISAALRTLISDGEMRRSMGAQNLKLAQALFDRAKTYPKIVELILAQ